MVAPEIERARKLRDEAKELFAEKDAIEKKLNRKLDEFMKAMDEVDKAGLRPSAV